MKLEEILRFTIPGSTVVVALLVAFWPFFKCLLDDGDGGIIAALVVILVVPIGYLMHQIYQMWHQSKWGRLASCKRPAFKLMQEKYKESKECTDIEAWQARLAWDSWFGRCAADERFANVLSTQHIWWLSSKTMMVAFSIGILLLIVSIIIYPPTIIVYPLLSIRVYPTTVVIYPLTSWSLTENCHLCVRMVLGFVYLVLVIFFHFKAKSTGNYLWLLERWAVADNWRQIEPLLDKIVKESPGISYSVGWWGRTVQGFPERKSPCKKNTER